MYDESNLNICEYTVVIKKLCVQYLKYGSSTVSPPFLTSVLLPYFYSTFTVFLLYYK